MNKILFLFPFCLLASIVYGQEYPSPSPKATITQVVGYTTVTLEYERPAKRGRTVFGGIVPYGKRWRTGAGHSTKISFDKDVLVSNQKVPSGKYALFTIPFRDEWIIILNRDTSLYGDWGYNSEKDVARFRVPSKRVTQTFESFVMFFDFIPDNLECYMAWENTLVSFPIKTYTSDSTNLYIDQALSSPVSKEVNYFRAIQYLTLRKERLSDALVLIDRHQSISPSVFIFKCQAEIYEYMGHTDMALKSVNMAKDLLLKGDFKDDYRSRNLIELRQFEERLLGGREEN